MTFMQIMTSPLLYVLVAAGIVYILIFCAITLRRSYKHALDIGISRENSIKYTDIFRSNNFST